DHRGPRRLDARRLGARRGHLRVAGDRATRPHGHSVVRLSDRPGLRALRRRPLRRDLGGARVRLLPCRPKGESMTATAIPAPLVSEAPRRRIRSRRPVSLWIGVTILAVLVGAGVFAIFWTPYPPMATGVGPVYGPPSLAHPFGTDRLGADILSRTMT